jgi:hypothetical protein
MNFLAGEQNIHSKLKLYKNEINVEVFILVISLLHILLQYYSLNFRLASTWSYPTITTAEILSHNPTANYCISSHFVYNSFGIKK